MQIILTATRQMLCMKDSVLPIEAFGGQETVISQSATILELKGAWDTLESNFFILQGGGNGTRSVQENSYL